MADGWCTCSQVGLHLNRGATPPTLLDPAALQALLAEKLAADPLLLSSFLAGLAAYLGDYSKVCHEFVTPTHLCLHWSSS